MPDTDLRRIVAILLTALGVLAVIATTSLVGGVPVPFMTRDIAALGHLHPLAGVLSNLGILLWAATAAICLFVAVTERGRLSAPVVRCLLFAGLLSAWLTLDEAASRSTRTSRPATCMCANATSISRWHWPWSCTSGPRAR